MFRLGTLRNKRPYPSLTPDEAKIVRDFTELVFAKHVADHSTLKTDWMGYRCIKYPTDMMQYQEIIVEQRPDIIIECGTHLGGTALFLATICQMVGHGRVLTIDIKPEPNRPEHELLTYLTGSTIEPSVFAHVVDFAGSAKCLVILDSNHNYEHVIQELSLYQRFVPIGGYIIVEDTHVNGHPTYLDHGRGPWEAVEDFVGKNDAFEIDRKREKFLMTLNPHGYLKRIK